MMDEHCYYLLVNIACVLVPFVFSFHPKLRFYLHFKSFVAGALLMMLLFIPWDVYFTHCGIWGFNDKYTLGIRWLGLPLEEWMFFVCIPFACCFTFHCLQYLRVRTLSFRNSQIMAVVLAVLCMVVAIFHYDRHYTFAAHLLCGVLLLLHALVWRSAYIKTFLLMYLLILVPFIVSNGVLTGVHFWQYPLINTDVDTIAEKIVWYNNDHNLRLRIFSMPIDDLAYGMLMLLLTITGYQWMERKSGTV